MALMSAAPMPSEASDTPKVVALTTQMLNASWTVHWLGLFVYALPFKLFLKSHFHLNAGATAAALLYAGFAFNLKPIFAWIGDTFPIGGYRRRSWTVVGGLLGAGFFLPLVAGFNSVNIYIAFIFVAVSGYVFVSCSIGGLMVESGTRNGNLGVLSSYRGALNQGVNTIVGPLAGYLAGLWIGWTWTVSAVCAGANALIIFFCGDRKVVVPITSPKNLIAGQLRTLLSSRSYWFALIAIALITIAPGFGTALTYYQTDTLKLQPQQIGNLTMFNGIGGLVMGLSCVPLMKRVSVGRLFLFTTILSAIGTLAYTQYSSFGHAMVIEPIGGFVSAGTTVAIFALAGHATPKGLEGLGYSVLMAVNNTVLGIGDVWGSKLIADYHVKFWELVLINAGTTLLALIVLPFMPKTLKNIKDVSKVPPSVSKSQSGHPVDE